MKRSIGKGAEQFGLVVMGGSAGVYQALPVVLGGLPPDFRLPVVIVRHVCPEFRDCGFSAYLNERCRLTVKEADQGELISGGHVYLAPANYHLLVERDRTLSLNIDEKVKYCRPAIDVLFETAAEALGSKLIGVILSGANDDGADGLKKIKDRGGYAIVQDPQTAECAVMPQAAAEACAADAILAPEEIAAALVRLAG